LAPAPPKRPKDIENVLVRVPASLRGLVADEATEMGLSQNAFITNFLLFGVLVYGERQYVGDPQNLIFLVNEIERAYQENDAAIGGFSDQDWAEVSYVVRMLEDCDLIANLKLRPDTRAKETTVFSFTLTRNGKASWPTLKTTLLLMAQAKGKMELMPMA